MRRIRDWGLGTGDEGDDKSNYQLPITNYHAQCPMPHAQQCLILFQPAENL